LNKKEKSKSYQNIIYQWEDSLLVRNVERFLKGEKNQTINALWILSKYKNS
jgi:hypothetical protein